MGQMLDDSGLDTVFRTARTYNGYKSDPVTQDHVRRIYDLLKMAPTSANQQPARFVWCMSQESRDRLADCATGANIDKIRKAPAAVVIGMDTDFHEELPWLFPHTDAKSWFDGNLEKRREHAFRNSSLQGAYFIIAARAIGLDTGPMSGFDPDAVNRAFFGDQPHVTANFISTFGVGNPDTVHARGPRPEFDKFNRID